MSNPRIEVDVVANVAGVASGVSAATSQLDKLGKAAQATAPKFENLSKTTSRYNSVGIDFARVIQDAPFGIIGVGNNIQQLAQSFSGLGQAGDSTKSKIKLAFGQIFSSGNALILAVSAITTILTLYEKGAFKSADATKSLRDQLEKYRETLNGVTKANLEGQISAQKELSNLKLLQIQAENTSLSQEKRNKAVDELQKQYPEYLKGLTDEQIKTGLVGEAYNKLTNDILALSKAKALSAELDKQASDLLTLRVQEEQRANEILQLREKLQVAINNKVDAGARVAGQFTAENSNAMIIQMNIDKLIKEQLKSADERNKIIKDQLFIESQIVEQSSKGANFVKDTGKAIDANKEKLKQYSQGWDDFNLGQETARELQDKLTFGLNLEKFNKQIQDAFAPEKEIKVKIKTDVILDEDIPDELPFIDRLLERLNPKKFTEFEERTAEFATTMLGILDGGLANAFVDLGQSIGEALATGGNVLSAVGKSLLGSVGNLLGQFGKQLIAFGVAGLSYSKLIKSLFTNPATAAPKAGLAIAAGIALVALSGAISSGLKSNSGGSGGGGGGGGASVGSSGVGGGTSFAGGGQGGLFAQNRDLNGELVVRGQDLVYVFGQASDRINKG